MPRTFSGYFSGKEPSLSLCIGSCSPPPAVASSFLPFFLRSWIQPSSTAFEEKGLELASRVVEAEWISYLQHFCNWRGTFIWAQLVGLG